MGLNPHVTLVSQTKRKKEQPMNGHLLCSGFCAQGFTRIVSLSSASPSEEGTVYYCSFPLTEGEAEGGEVDDSPRPLRWCSA